MKTVSSPAFDSTTFAHLQTPLPHQLLSASPLKELGQYGIAAALFTIYGVQVCPFLDTLDTGFFIGSVALLFLGMYVVRWVVMNHMIKAGGHDLLQKQWLTDMAIFVSGGLVLSAGNQLIYGFPVDSSVRVVIGITLLGLLISLQLVLQKEYQLIGTFVTTSEKYTPIANKMQFFMVSLLIGAFVVILLVIFKDIEWLQRVGEDITLEQAAMWITYEIAFVAVVFIGYGLVLINRFAKNLRAYFDYQNSTLMALQEGQRNIAVPTISNNEFGVMARYTNQMIDSLRQQEELLKQTRDAAILAISSLAETRDNETGAHILRTQAYVRALGLHLQQHPRFRDALTSEKLELIHKSAPLHDIGKVGIPDSILLKPGKLTDEEFATMKSHPLIGRQAIEAAEEQVGELPFLRYAKEISESHHEKWDGSGYPYGLQGDAIPVSGRLMALADVYDALITKRVYKPAFSHDKAKGIILEGKGKHFDPDIVDAFLAIEHEFIAIAQQYQDKEA